MAKVIHYRKKCIGCHMCCENAPHYWSIDQQDGKARLKNSVEKKDNLFIAEIEEFEEAEHIQAAKNCPANIIQVKSQKGETLAP